MSTTDDGEETVDAISMNDLRLLVKRDQMRSFVLEIDFDLKEIRVLA
jgi:hypothetical protein